MLVTTLKPGVVEVVEQFPADRKTGKDIMRDGMVEIRCGDQVMELTPSEAGKVGQMLMGEATIFAQLRGDRDLQDQVSRLARQADEAKRQRAEDKRRMDEMAKTIARLRQQPELAFE